MNFHKVTYEATGYHKTPVFRLFADIGGRNMPLRLIVDSEFDNSKFLCSTENEVTISKIYYNKEDKYYYVLSLKNEEIKAIDLNEIYLIEK